MTQHAIHFLPEVRDVARVGGKAAVLARLAELGFDVPAFFVIEPTRAADDAQPGIDAALQRLGEGRYAVRSSGREEDGSAHSHAGQFLSLLGVAAADVPAAVGRVRASGATDSLKEYRRSRGLDPEGGMPAVIVQRMVDARAAGVAFSADPVSGRRDRIVISATAGLGDRLVGGEIDGEQHILDGATGAVFQAPEEGGTMVLAPQDVAAVAALARKVAEAFGTPQDIEWALAGDRLYLLQARAITTPLRAIQQPDHHTTIFDNSNIVESYPGFVTPLTYSFAQYAYARVYRAFLAICGIDAARIRANGAALDNMLGRIDGRVYYNLVNWYRLLALLPGFSLNRTHMEAMMGVDEPLPKDIADTLAPPRPQAFAALAEWARVGRMAGKLAFEAIRLRRTIKGFHGRLEAALANDAAAIDRMSLTELARNYRSIEATLLDRWDAPLINDFLCMIAFGSSRKLTERWLGASGLALHNDVMIGQGDIISAEPPRRIARMGRLVAGDAAMIAALARGDRSALAANPALAAEFDDYIARFGDRCTEELKLESITLDVNPRPLLASIAAAASQPAGEARRVGDGIERLDTLLAGKPMRRAILKRVLGWARARVRDRENLRFERTRIFGRARRVFLAIGRQLHAHDRLDAERDIFFVTVQEVLGAIEGAGLDRDLKALVAMRKQQWARDCASPYPGDRVVMIGAVVTNEVRAAAPAATQAGDGELQGTGCSVGIVTARARVISDPAREHLDRGEILVARHTDPGWISLFTNASAIVVERGSLLSHSAIVARELGIPCVVGLKGAMAKIASGDTLEVDGASGKVRKLS
ncbi:MAG: phosphoenolpyruvate synthase [Hyphomicrobium sp.]|nr:phosphoenolpyruvate synthase [Hyphomicrobium sp.]PPC82536.1 MAG: phosphoenolpyruvate synthase [Hyphomicrobium sp.]